MRCEVLAPQLPALPSCAVYSRRYGAIYSGSPFLVFPADPSKLSQTPRVAFQGHTDCFCLSRDERNIAISTQALIKLYDIDSGREIRNLAAHCLPVHAICPKKNSIYNWFSGSLDSTWVMWDTRSHPAKVLDGRANGPVRCLEMSPDDSVLAVGTDTSLQLYDIRNRQVLSRFSYSTTGLSFNPAEKLLAVYGLDRVVRFICMDQLECVSVSDPMCGDIKGLAFAGFSPENDFLVVGSDLEMRLLTWEPCDTLASCQLPTDRHVLNISLGEDSVDVVSYTAGGALILNTHSIENLLCPELADPPSPIEDPKTPETPETPPDHTENEEEHIIPVMPPSKAKRSTSERPLLSRPPSLPRNSRQTSEDRVKTVITRSDSPSTASLKKEPSPIPARKPSPASNHRLRRSESQPPSDPLNEAIFERLKKLHKLTSKKSEQRVLNLRQAERIIRQEGLIDAVKKDIAFFDPYVAMKVVKKISADRSWDIGRTSSLLPRIKECLLEPGYQAVAVKELRNVCDAMLDTLVKCARHQSLIGVDVAGEERKEKAEESLKVLREIRDGRNRFYKKMPSPLAEDLDAVIFRLKSL